MMLATWLHAVEGRQMAMEFDSKGSGWFLFENRHECEFLVDKKLKGGLVMVNLNSFMEDYMEVQKWVSEQNRIFKSQQ
jgi:hypothetical protein